VPCKLFEGDSPAIISIRFLKYRLSSLPWEKSKYSMPSDQISLNGNMDDKIYAKKNLMQQQHCGYEFQCCLQVAHNSELNQSS
jgi:hypothetical protein